MLSATYRRQGVRGADGRVGAGLLQERLVLVERGQPVQQRLQHGGHLVPDGRLDGHALVCDLADVRHHPFVAEVVRELVRPLGQQLHQTGHEPRQLVLEKNAVVRPVSTLSSSNNSRMFCRQARDHVHIHQTFPERAIGNAWLSVVYVGKKNN